MTTFRIGVDEAGKGPVLGPMTAAAVRAAAADLPTAVADSKRLSPAKRESLAATLRDSEAVDIGLGVVTVDEIDDPETDMNGLTVDAQVRAIAAVAEPGDEAIVDAGDVSESRFGRRVREGVASEGVEIAVTAEHGADDSHPLAAAASIVAKVERDRRMAAVGSDYPDCGPVGSGYPSDRTTREFLAAYVDRHGDLPACARRSWSTCEDVLAAAEQTSLGEF
ncbi:ribonuclease HII [Halohasta salina]|uniref:ribonuclease HII n=1 Tax=Halohasta salina TaxID=2961621 RepID=UPI0020A3B8FB|nr:ribonuclease HII [Halohasta salina]